MEGEIGLLGLGVGAAPAIIEGCFNSHYFYYGLLCRCIDIPGIFLFTWCAPNDESAQS